MLLCLYLLHNMLQMHHKITKLVPPPPPMQQVRMNSDKSNNKLYCTKVGDVNKPYVL